MADKKTAVFGIYSTRNGAEQAADALVSAGFASGDISVLLPENLGTREIGNREVDESSRRRDGWCEHWRRARRGAWDCSRASARLRFLALDRSSRRVRSWPRWPGMGAGGTVGGLTGALVGAGIPEFEAKRYEGIIQKGGILLSVHCSTSEEVTRAKQILKGTGGEDVSSTGEASVDKADRARGTTA